MESNSAGWAVGLERDGSTGAIKGGVILRYSEGQWTQYHIPWFSLDGLRLYAVQVISTTTGWEAWTAGSRLRNGQQEEIDILHYTSSADWERFEQSNIPDISGALKGLSVFSVGKFWAVGDLYVGYLNGDWSQEKGTRPLWNVHILPNGQAGWAVGDNGYVAKFMTARCLEKLDPPCWDESPQVGDPFRTKNLYDVRLIAPDDAWIVGEEESIWHFDGNRWRLKHERLLGGNLYGVDFVPSGEGWAIGADGVILHYTSPSPGSTRVPTPTATPRMSRWAE